MFWFVFAVGAGGGGYWTAGLDLRGVAFSTRYFCRSTNGYWLGLDEVGQERLPYKAGILSLALMVLIGLMIFRKMPRTEGTLDG